MLLHVKGSNKKTRKLIHQASWYYAEKLMGTRLMGTLSVTIDLKRNMSEKEGWEGSAIWDDWDDFKKTPRDYTIELDCSMSIRNILINLAHEFVHIKQWGNGDMYE